MAMNMTIVGVLGALLCFLLPLADGNKVKEGYYMIEGVTFRPRIFDKWRVLNGGITNTGSSIKLPSLTDATEAPEVVNAPDVRRVFILRINGDKELEAKEFKRPKAPLLNTIARCTERGVWRFVCNRSSKGVQPDKKYLLTFGVEPGTFEYQCPKLPGKKHFNIALKKDIVLKKFSKTTFPGWRVYLGKPLDLLDALDALDADALDAQAKEEQEEQEEHSDE